MAYGVRKCGDDSHWWMDTRTLEVLRGRAASAWTRDPAKARLFTTAHDAEQAAYCECSLPFPDVQIVEVKAIA